MNPITLTLTKDEFLKREIRNFGEDHIFDLIDKGYTIVETDNGTFGWLMPNTAGCVDNGLDTGSVMCYDGYAGVSSRYAG